MCVTRLGKSRVKIGAVRASQIESKGVGHKILQICSEFSTKRAYMYREVNQRRADQKHPNSKGLRIDLLCSCCQQTIVVLRSLQSPSFTKQTSINRRGRIYFVCDQRDRQRGVFAIAANILWQVSRSSDFLPTIDRCLFELHCFQFYFDDTRMQKLTSKDERKTL